MSLAMDFAALCDMWRLKWHQWMMPFGLMLSVDVVSASHFVPPYHPPSTPIGVLVVLAMPIKLSKIVIHLTVQWCTDKL